MIITIPKNAKGVSKPVLNKNITHNDYVKVLNSGEPISIDVVGIRSFNHQLYTVKQNKIVLTSCYDKMRILDTINCVPFGYVGK